MSETSIKTKTKRPNSTVIPSFNTSLQSFCKLVHSFVDRSPRHVVPGQLQRFFEFGERLQWCRRGGTGGHVPPTPIRPGHENRRDPMRNFLRGRGVGPVFGPNVMLDNYILYCVVSCNLFFFSACSDVNCLIIADAEQTQGFQFTPFWNKTVLSSVCLDRMKRVSVADSSYEFCGLHPPPPSLEGSVALWLRPRP